MFGGHELRTQFIKIGDKKLHLLELEGDFVRYRRDDVERLIKRRDGEKLEVLPAPAEGYGIRLLMVVLREPLAIPPGEEVVGFLEAPVDVEVRTGELTIDRFVVGREKYALYGSVEAGAIARYHVSSFTLKEPDSLGVMVVSITNPTRNWEGIDKVVVPIRGSTMYYSPEKAYYPLVKVSLGDAIPEVNNTGKPPKEGLMVSGRKKALPNFLMRW